jgi:hypothetical protein
MDHEEIWILQGPYKDVLTKNGIIGIVIGQRYQPLNFMTRILNF